MFKQNGKSTGLSIYTIGLCPYTITNYFGILPAASWDLDGGSGGVPELRGARSFTFEELSKYTNNFSEINNIGRGGYGMVSDSICMYALNGFI